MMTKERTMYHDPYAQSLVVAPQLSDRDTDIVNMVVEKVYKNYGAAMATLRDSIQSLQYQADKREWRFQLLKEPIPGDKFDGTNPQGHKTELWQAKCKLDDLESDKELETYYGLYSVARREGFKAGIALMAKHLVPGADPQELLSVIRALTDPEHAEALLASLEVQEPKEAEKEEEAPAPAAD